MEVRNFDGNETFISRGPSVLDQCWVYLNTSAFLGTNPFICGSAVQVRGESLEVFGALLAFSAVLLCESETPFR